MSATTPPPTARAGMPAKPGAEPPSPQRRPGRRRMLIGAGAAAVVAAVIVALLVVDPFAGDGAAGAAGRSGSPSTAIANVRRGPLSSQLQASGTLGFAARADGSAYAVVNQAAGTYTELPEAGDVVRCGRELYRVSDQPVVLLCGDVPAYRSLSEGISGPDVRELNANLVDLGYATKSQIDRSSDYFGAATADALERLQDELGVDQTGTLRLGQAVVLDGPLRITKVTATPGTPARPATPVAQATSTRREVQVDLDASTASSVEVGDRVRITLPDGSTTRGSVGHIGTTASGEGGSGAQGGSDSAGATLPVQVELEHPDDVQGVDRAPVQVAITTDGVKRALSVPVTALLALAGGGYAVETVGAGSRRELVPVELGLFDDAGGRVQVTSTRLSAGQRILVPAT